MTTIYGLRLKGDWEVRYVGQTADVAKRLAGHFTTANNMPWATNFAAWLLDNKDQIEAVELDVVANREQARAAERNAVGFCLALDHRLFNQWLVPPKMRCAPRAELCATPTGAEARAA